LDDGLFGKREDLGIRKEASGNILEKDESLQSSQPNFLPAPLMVSAQTHELPETRIMSDIENSNNGSSALTSFSLQ